MERLIGVMRENINEEEKEAENVQEKGKEKEQEGKADRKCVEVVGKWEGSISGRKEERNVEKERESDEEEDLRYIAQYTVVSDREDEVIQIEGENLNRVGGSKGRRRREGQEGKTGQRETSERETAQSWLAGSAIRGKEKRPFRLLGEEEKEEEIRGVAGRGTKKKKGEAGALIDAVTILASAKNDSEDKRYDLLNWHLIQQGDLRREELQLERERLAIKSEKAKAEQRCTELMMLQL